MAQGQVLVAAPSNVAVDQLAEKIHQAGLKSFSRHLCYAILRISCAYHATHTNSGGEAVRQEQRGRCFASRAPYASLPGKWSCLSDPYFLCLTLAYFA
eukprot:scaffold204254_cov35-Prasinocladus_malaysianus.AAC.1